MDDRIPTPRWNFTLNFTRDKIRSTTLFNISSKHRTFYFFHLQVVKIISRYSKKKNHHAKIVDQNQGFHFFLAKPNACVRPWSRGIPRRASPSSPRRPCFLGWVSGILWNLLLIFIPGVWHRRPSRTVLFFRGSLPREDLYLKGGPPSSLVTTVNRRCPDPRAKFISRVEYTIGVICKSRRDFIGRDKR